MPVLRDHDNVYCEGDLVRASRQARGLTQLQLVEAAGLTSIFRLSRIERNISKARPEEADRIVGVLASEDRPAAPPVREPIRPVFGALLPLRPTARR
jgi:transcriptional regulator with XRE-family HTH domain